MYLIHPHEFMLEGMEEEHIDVILDIISWKILWQNFKEKKDG